MQTDINSKSLDGTQSRFARRPQTVKEWVSAICKNLNYLAMSPDCPFEEFSERDWRDIVYGDQSYWVDFFHELHRIMPKKRLRGAVWAPLIAASGVPRIVLLGRDAEKRFRDKLPRAL